MEAFEVQQTYLKSRKGYRGPLERALRRFSVRPRLFTQAAFPAEKKRV